ncbi:binder of Arl Two-like protein [Rhizoclosmatium globosum]|uniref:ADP-ribosylation factor-like protein 2-binding protein n=1 Tax=Rhizoclosmatium globosum TaxID=329046 RepID=A0A1Y2BST6_9FUNG|nr:binder of Arl Two-like protein [Rhizoclosmatium globosum]|eukprot:ORY37806.1 binder of Arl Two-like protein [Rhizoclosmatium globosum]
MAATSSKQIVDISASIQASNDSMDWDDEDLMESGSASEEDQLFDLIVGTLEDLLMDDSFVDFQNKFMEKNCKHFSTTEDENKLIYMDIFSAYTAKVEAYIEKKLRAEIPEFNMNDFLDLLRSRPEQLEGDVFDMMASIGDFSAFKEMMVSFKQEQEGSGIDLSGLLAVTNSKSQIGVRK